MSFTTVDGITIHYVREGAAAGPPLVFVNSLGTDLQLWDEVVPAFADRFDLVRYDKRGHGLSDSPPGPYALSDHTADLTGLLDHLDIAAPLLVGISIGGLIALDFATRREVRALVLADTAARIGTEASWNERIAAVKERGMAVMADVLVGRWFSSDFPARRPAVYRGYRNMLARTPAAGYVASCAALRDADLTGAVGAVTARALVLAGAEDVATPPELARGLAEALPDSRFELVDGAGHLPCVEQPQAMAAAIDRFLQENGYG